MSESPRDATMSSTGDRTSLSDADETLLSAGDAVFFISLQVIARDIKLFTKVKVYFIHDGLFKLLMQLKMINITAMCCWRCSRSLTDG